MINRLAERLIAVLIILFLLIYVGYQAVRYYYKPITTETVYEYSVSQSVTVSGIAIRDEMVIDQPVSGVQNYVYEDATRVAVGETIAEFYRSASGDKNVKRARELEQEISMLLEAQDKNVSNYGNTDTFNRDIKDKLGAIATMSSTGRFSEVNDVRQSLVSLLNKKQIATGKSLDFTQRIEQLQSELDQLARSNSAESVTTVEAPVSGYFSKSLDGYEAQLTTELLESKNVDDYVQLLQGSPPVAPGGKVGKMVLNQNWYFVVCLPKYDVDWVRQGQTLDIQFDQVSEGVPATVYRIVDEKDQDTAALVLRCNMMSEELINLRDSDAVLHFQQYSGLRININNLRFLNNERGVYILDDHTVRFKKVDPVYEEPTFLLSRMNYTGSMDHEHIRLFDQIITKGNDLYDGKVIQDY